MKNVELNLLLPKDFWGKQRRKFSILWMQAENYNILINFEPVLYPTWGEAATYFISTFS